MNLSKQVRNNDNSSNSINRAIVDYTSPALCTPVTPSRRQVMGSIVNVPEEDRATDIGNTHKKFGKDRAGGSGDILADSQADRQTDILITSNKAITNSRFRRPVCNLTAPPGE